LDGEGSITNSPTSPSITLLSTVPSAGARSPPPSPLLSLLYICIRIYFFTLLIFSYHSSHILYFSSISFGAPNERAYFFRGVSSVADPDPGSGTFLPPDQGSGIRNRFIPDPGYDLYF
jgi:hypothetical protein